MSKRQTIIEAAKNLLWEQGFEAMSPNKVMRLSSAGQGSLYHHFEGKEDLALTALGEVDIELRVAADKIFDKTKDPLDRLYDYILGPRSELNGCRLGRLSYEKTVFETDICTLIGNYFSYISQHLSVAIDDAKAAGELPHHLDADALSKALHAVIQGGYILARGTHNRDDMSKAQEGAWAMIEALSIRQ